MENVQIRDFDAAHALNHWAHSTRVQATDDQHRLDIIEKERTSALPWRGQFSPQLIEYLLAKHSKKGDCVLDPFCGSGTVLHEAARTGLNALGLDVNPAAVCLAKVSELSRVEPSRRWTLIDCVRSFGKQLLFVGDTNSGVIDANSAARTLCDSQLDEIEQSALEGFLLLLFANGNSVDANKTEKAIRRYISVIGSLPKTDSRIAAKIGDARYAPIEGGCVDYLVTSPPYINVFNYHQNYRPIIEALGHRPLAAAKSEIGANRKFRQNRYMTVVQYCIDMAQFLVEADRVLKEKAKITIVLGRESSVRSVSFKTGELISAIACEGMGFELKDWHERKFINRFGEAIYEDVLTMTSKTCASDQAVQIGRAVGVQALRNALSYCPTERGDEISGAIAFADNIQASPTVGGAVDG